MYIRISDPILYSSYIIWTRNLESYIKCFLLFTCFPVSWCLSNPMFYIMKSFQVFIEIFFLFSREFIENHLLDFTRKNPGIVVYLKPRRHRKPVLYAEYCKIFFSFQYRLITKAIFISKGLVHFFFLKEKDYI